MDEKQMESIIEGILFTFGEAVEPSRIAKALEVETKDVIKTLEHMKESWKSSTRRPFPRESLKFSACRG